MTLSLIAGVNRSRNSLIRNGIQNESRKDYMATFSSESWKKLPLHMKRTHTLANCEGCQLTHANLQAKFPSTKHKISSVQLMHSCAQSSQAAMHIQPIANKRLAQEVTRKSLSTINQASEQALGMPFSPAIAEYCPEEKVIRKPTDTERKQQQRKVMRRCTKHLENQMGGREALNVLAENQSLSSYKRMRMSQSFENPEAKRQRYAKSTLTAKKHSPDFSKVTWDTERLQTTLSNWPENAIFNWSRVAREHWITAKNGGQIVKVCN